MCRSIVTLRRPEGLAEPDEIEAAALQFVRKISGYRKPSQRNEAAFRQAVDDIAEASSRMLAAIGQPLEPSAGHGSGHVHSPSMSPHATTRVATMRSSGRASRS